MDAECLIDEYPEYRYHTYSENTSWKFIDNCLKFYLLFSKFLSSASEVFYRLDFTVYFFILEDFKFWHADLYDASCEFSVDDFSFFSDLQCKMIKPDNKSWEDYKTS